MDGQDEGGCVQRALPNDHGAGEHVGEKRRDHEWYTAWETARVRALQAMLVVMSPKSEGREDGEPAG